VQIIGYLGKDPEAKSVGEGTLVTFPMATTEIWRDKAAREPKEKTQWHNIAIWNEALGEVAMKYLKKGSQAYVQGQIETRAWDKDGESTTPPKSS
jgi:single-strand DNA-binding protein